MKRLTAFAMASIFCAVSATAATLAEYNFNGNNLTSSDTELNTTAGNISSGSGITGGTDLSTNQGEGGTRGIQIRYDDIYTENTGDRTLADAITDQVYYSFTITPLAGQVINFDTFTAYTDKNGGGATFEYHIMSSIGGFTDSSTIDSSSHTSGVANLSYDISSLTNVSTATEFRLYIRTDNYTNGSNLLDIDNIILTGTVIPEPSTALLGVFGGLLLLRRRR